MTEITLIGELTDLNTYINTERRNRFMGAKVKKDNTESVMWQTKKVKPITEYPVHIYITWYVKDQRKDPDNIAFAKKFILDALVENGILTNDGQKQISGFQDLILNDKKNPRTVIQIIPVF
jgi:Holliday junction resolvase RusA-like endonuclease